MKIVSLRIAIMLYCMILKCAADTIHETDFIHDSYSTTNQWNLSEIEFDDDNGIKFAATDLGVETPIFPGSILESTFKVRCMNMQLANPSSLSVFGRASASEGWQECGNAVFINGATTNLSFRFSRQQNIHQLRIVYTKISGNLRISSASIIWRGDDEVETPSDLQIHDITTNGFSAIWHTDEPVDGFKAYLWNDGVTQWSGERIWSEEFSKSVNTRASSMSLNRDGVNMDTYTDNAGWRGEFIYIPPSSEGLLQLNKTTSSTGWLESPILPEIGIITAVIRARAYVWQNNRIMAISKIRNGVTNSIADVELSDEMKDYILPDIDISAGDKLLFRSFIIGSQRRTLLDSVHLVRGFSPGIATTNWIMNASPVMEKHIEISDLNPGATYKLAISAVANGKESSMSEIRTVTLPISSSQEIGKAEGDWEGAKITAASTNSFSLSWIPMENAVSYRLSVWTNAVHGANPGTVIWEDEFSKAPSSSSTSVLKDDTLNEEYADIPHWTVLSNVYPSAESGTIRIGNTSKHGALLSPEITDIAGKTLLIRAWKHSDSDGRVMPIATETAETVTSLGTLSISDEPTDFHLQLPDTIGDSVRIIINSTTNINSSRVIIDRVAVLDGYSRGTISPVYLTNGVSITDTGYTLPPSDTTIYHYSVAAIDAAGNEISACDGSVDLSNPPPCPVLEPVRISSLRRVSGSRIWNENFDRFSTIYPTSKTTADWYNGYTLPPWQIFKGADAPSSLSRNFGSATASGFYAYCTADKNVSSYALGSMSTEESPVLLCGTVFANDTDNNIRKIHIQYRGMQFGFKNIDSQEIVFEFLITNELVNVDCDGNWIENRFLSFVSPIVGGGDTLISGQSPPETSGLSTDTILLPIPKKSYLLVRWRREAAVKGAALAIDDIEVDFEEARSFIILIR